MLILFFTIFSFMPSNKKKAAVLALQHVLCHTDFCVRFDDNEC